MRQNSVQRSPLRFLGFGLAAACGLSIIPSAAKAAFVISSERFTGPNNTEVVVFRALNNGAVTPSSGPQGTGSKLQSINITESSPTGLNYDFPGDGTVNVTGFGMNFPTATTPQGSLPTGSFMRVGSATSFSLGSAAPDPNDDNNYKPPAPGATSFNIQGFPSSPPVASTNAVPFAVAVVPTGAPVTITGFIAGDLGTPSGEPVNVTNGTGVPEPASLGLLGIGSLGLLARRRRTV